ncbi:hypothetical protein BH20ACT6_BH20ACT6_14750 [soil metagenome]
MLLSSPLLGPAVWRPVQQALSTWGSEVATVPASASKPLVSPADVLGEFLDGIPTDRPVVVVAHSNAGLYVPALVRDRVVDAMVFVDAGLPPPAGHTPLAPPPLLDLLRESADRDGLLPVWTHWWEQAEVEALFPTAALRLEVEREQRRLPLSYFEGSLPVADGWDARPGAYVAFGDTYAPERDDAESRGWPVRTLQGGHLHMLHAPDDVAAGIQDLLGQLGSSPTT